MFGDLFAPSLEASVLLVIVMPDGGQFRVPLEGGQ